MSASSDLDRVDLDRSRDRHAEYRTLLAEKRTALAEAQVALLLVTVPLTIHTGLTVLATRHQIVQQLHLLIPFWLVLVALFVGGVASGFHALRTLRHVSGALACFWSAGRRPSGP